MQKKIFGILLVLCMLLGVLLAMPASAANVIEITTAEQILKLMNGDAEYPLDGNYLVKNDIDLSTYTGSLTQKTIGSHPDSACFTGTFDGGEYTISGFNLTLEQNYSGFFGAAGRGAVIKNLTVSGSITNATKNATGGILGYGRDTLTIENCVSNVTVKGNARAAGFIGGYDCMTADSTLILKDCINNGTITAADTQGAGIVGRIVSAAGSAGFDLSISNCKNNGVVTAKNQVAGIVSNIELKDSATVLVSACVNDALVTAAAPATAGDYCAGILAFLKISGSSATVEVEDCVNKGSINAFQYGGGILGLAELATTNGDATVLVKDCLNQGAVSSKSFLGGIAGRINASGASAAPTGKIELLNCKNEGEISNVAANSYAFVGGIIGFASITDEPMRIAECINTGTINGNTAGSDAAGGIAGNLRNYKDTANAIVVEDCYNSGDVVTAATTAGGIVGSTNKTGGAGISNIRNCVNNASVSIGSDAGAGIIGDDSGADATALATCHNIDGTVQNMTGLDSEFWVIGTTRSEPKALHTTHYYEPTTTGKHNCPCGEVAEGNCNYVDYVCDICGVDQPIIELTVAALNPAKGIVTFSPDVAGAAVSVDFDALNIYKSGDAWFAIDFTLTGADKEHYALDTQSFEFVPDVEDVFTITANGEAEEVYRGQYYNAVADSAAEGFKYLGWYDGDVLLTTDYVYVIESVTASMTITAKYEKVATSGSDSNHNNAVAAIAIALRNQRTATVKFKSTGAKLYNVQTVKANGILVLPEAPTKDGYIFAGWYRDINGTKPIDFTAKLSGDVTLYAKWVKA